MLYYSHIHTSVRTLAHMHVHTHAHVHAHAYTYIGTLHSMLEYIHLTNIYMMVVR